MSTGVDKLPQRSLFIFKSFQSYGLRILTSRDAKKAYTHGTAAVFRMKDEVLKDVSLIRENCGDIAAEAKELNEKRQAMEEAQQIEDAKAILAAANVSAE